MSSDISSPSLYKIMYLDCSALSTVGDTYTMFSNAINSDYDILDEWQSYARFTLIVPGILHAMLLAENGNAGDQPSFQESGYNSILPCEGVGSRDKAAPGMMSWHSVLYLNQCLNMPPNKLHDSLSAVACPWGGQGEGAVPPSPLMILVITLE